MRNLLATLRLLWAHHKPTMILMAAACAAVLFFAVQFVFDHRHWRDRPPERPEVEAWMTIRFVARAYDHPPEEIRAAIAYSDPERRLSFQDIASRQGRDVSELMSDLNSFLDTEEAERKARHDKKHRKDDKDDKDTEGADR